MNAPVFANPSEISGQKQQKLHQAAGERSAATGIAAAFAASLAILSYPVGDALAAQSTVQVDVVNPATNPALTRNVDDPGRIAYQTTVTNCSLTETTCSFSFPAVPQGHRLVVEHVSGFLSLNSNASGANVFLTGGANEARSSFFALPGLQFASSGSILFDQAVLQYLDAGSAPFIATVTDVIPNANGSTATVSGYLLDCATTLCEAIAP